uniref:Uncharacterized protein n=1 Tax=Pseudomonas phage RVTF4 TaxID=3236931 RepID=A0AB39CCR2_9VIRU
MIQFKPEALQLVLDANAFVGGNKFDGHYHNVLKFMGENHPDFFDGVNVVPDDGDDLSSWRQWRAYLRAMIQRGAKFEVANTRSYWFVHEMEIEVGFTKHRAICLEYVSQYGDVFTGHGSEYYPIGAYTAVMAALTHRVKHGMTITPTTMGFQSVIDAEAMAEIYKDEV